MVFPPPAWMWMTVPLNRFITNPLIVLPTPIRGRHPTPAPALAPLISIIGVPLKPGCVVPSMITGSLTLGSPDVNEIVWRPPPPMLNAIVSVPGLALASRIACLKEPLPLSFVLVTVNVCPAGLDTMARCTRTVDAVENVNRNRQRLLALGDLRRWEWGIL